MNTSRTFLALAALALAGGTVTAHAQDMNAVRQRMEQRLSSLDALKDKGLVGENNRGYLEARGALSPADSSRKRGPWDRLCRDCAPDRLELRPSWTCPRPKACGDEQGGRLGAACDRRMGA